MRKSTRVVPSPAAFALAVLATFSGACATTATSRATGTNPEVLVDANGDVYRTTDTPTATSFAASPDSTFKAAVAAYTALGVEPTTIDPSRRLVARQQMLLRSRFQGEALSTVFDCGVGQLGPRADQGRVVADFTTRIVASGSGSVMSTMIQASVTTNDGASHDPIRCVSRGEIEEQLRREVSIRLGIRYEKP